MLAESIRAIIEAQVVETDNGLSIDDLTLSLGVVQCRADEEADGPARRTGGQDDVVTRSPGQLTDGLAQQTLGAVAANRGADPPGRDHRDPGGLVTLRDPDVQDEEAPST